MEQFTFNGFLPEEALRFRAERAFNRILALAPSDARVTAVMTKGEREYHCDVEIGSALCPIAVSVRHKLPSMALDKAELSVLGKLGRWSGSRFLQLEGKPRRVPLRPATV